MKRLLFMMTFAALATLSSAQTKQITLDDIWARSPFHAKRASFGPSMNDGEHYTAMSRTGIDKYSYKTGEKVESICNFSLQNSVKAKPLPPIESYEFSSDEQHILLSSGFEPIYRHSGVSDYYVYSVADGSYTKISDEGKQRLTSFSPDGKMVAYVRDNNLFYKDLATLTEHQITFDGKFNSIIYGTTDWVYEEEFAITRGFYFSPDSRKIAFYRFDESKVKQYSMQMWGDLYPNDYTYKYPKAGEDNSKVEIWIYDLATGNISKPELGSNNDQYLPRFQWTKDANTLAVMRMNRLQNKMELLHVNATTLAVSTILVEEDAAYVEVPDIWQYLSDGKNFLITSEKDGFKHLYMYDISGRLVKQLTSGSWEVANICGIDEKSGNIYFTAHYTAPINTDLMKTNFKAKKASITRIGEPVGNYSATFSNGCKYYLLTYNNANTPTSYYLYDSKDKVVKVLEDNAQWKSELAEYGIGRKQFGQLTTSNGDQLNYYMILPPDFDSTKQYPIFFYVYGGPGNQQVTNNWIGGGDNYWFHMLSQKGYVVACFDGRGTGGRGAAWKKCTYKNLGKYECEDAIEAAKWFGRKSWIDETRMGIFGWSFGGYLSSLCILKGNDVFKSAIAVAPVMTWRYYDNIYTERFLQRPQDNPQGYDENSPIKFADRLKGNYLLVHGTGDDNVHFQNSADMITALHNANKQFEFRIYPNKNHSIYGGNTRLNLYTLMTDFIDRKL